MNIKIKLFIWIESYLPNIKYYLGNYQKSHLFPSH